MFIGHSISCFMKWIFLYLLDVYVINIFSQSVGDFLSCVFLRVDAFNFHEVQFIFFSVYGWCFMGHLEETFTFWNYTQWSVSIINILWALSLLDMRFFKNTHLFQRSRNRFTSGFKISARHILYLQGLFKHRFLAPHSKRLWFNKSRVEPENLSA